MAASSDTWLRRAAAATMAVLAVAVGIPAADADPNALWTIVNGQCVPDERANEDPAPCALVDLDGGEQQAMRCSRTWSARRSTC